ncbi:MAG TPA: protocatechuate 3,4-dioxygenase subunit alpha [Burkholderiales bacterium]
MSLFLTAAQTVGPFVAISFEDTQIREVAPAGVNGERVVVQGRILDGDSKPVEDAVIETWQANAHGKYAHPEDTREKLLEPAFKGFGRVMSDRQGAFRFSTIKPGRVPGPHGRLQAPHLVVLVFMRGLLKHLVTRIYFPEEPANAEDPILTLVAADRRSTLIARKAGDGVLEWNVVLQGENETVFFDY